MNNGISVVWKHENFLEILSCADLKFKDVFFGFCSNFFKISDGISDSDRWWVLIDASNSVTFLKDVFSDPVDWLDQIVFGDSFSVH